MIQRRPWRERFSTRRSEDLRIAAQAPSGALKSFAVKSKTHRPKAPLQQSPGRPAGAVGLAQTAGVSSIGILTGQVVKTTFNTAVQQRRVQLSRSGRSATTQIAVEMTDKHGVPPGGEGRKEWVNSFSFHRRVS